MLGKLGYWGVSALGAITLLAACGPVTDSPDSTRYDTRVEPRAETAPRAAPEDRGFEFLRYATNTRSRTPEVCLTFSDALDPQADYSAYLGTEEALALSVEGARLCLGGLSFNDTLAVTLRAGLPAADGQVLKADQSLTLSFEDRPAYVGFAGSGVILPRIDADGLAVETVNVNTLEVSIRRLSDRALAYQRISEGFTGQADSWRTDGVWDDPGERGVEIWRGEVDVEGALNAATTTVLPLTETLGALQPGAYYVALRDAEAVARNAQYPARAGRWLIVTDLAFTAYRGETGLDVVVRSLQSARPVAQVDVELIAFSNEVLARACTDEQGRVRFDRALMAGRQGARPVLLTAYGASGDFAMLDLDRSPVDLSNQPVAGRVRPDLAEAYVYLDRGIYRPGESVEMSALLRDSVGAALTDRAGALVLIKPNGLEQARQRFDAAPRAGGLNQRFDLPQAAARGVWRVQVELDGLGVVGGARLQVEDFVPQRVELVLDADEAPLLRDQARTLTADVRFLYGAPGAGLPVQGSARLVVDHRPFPQHEGFGFGLHDAQFAETILNVPATVADGQGRAVLSLDPQNRGAQATRPLRLQTVVRVQEPGGRAVAETVSLPYRPRDQYWGLRAGFEGRPERDEVLGFEVLAVDALGAAMTGEAGWRLIRTDYSYDWYRTPNGAWQWRRSERVVPIEAGVVRLTGEGPVRIETPPLDWGQYSLVLSQAGEDLASTGFWTGWGGYARQGDPAPDEVTIAGPDSVETGGMARLMLSAPYAGWAEVVVATDRVIDAVQIAIPEGGAELSLPVTEDWGAGAYVMVNVYTPRDAVTQPRPRRAVGVAYVPVDVTGRTLDLTLQTPDRVEPNQTLSVPVAAVNGPAAELVYMTVAAVDEGILQLTNFQSPDPVQALFGKTALDVALLDDYGRLLDPNQGAAAPVRSGGDQIGGAGLSVTPTQTVALFSGPVTLDDQGQGRVTLDLPDFNGELRLMAVAWSETGLGAASQSLTVRDDVAAEIILPRFLAPGDEAQATITLDNVSGPDGIYATRMRVDRASVAETQLETPLSQGERRDAAVWLSSPEEDILQVALEVQGPEGFTAQSVYPLQVRSAYWPVTRLDRVTLAPGQSYTPDPQALAGFVPGSGLLQVSAAANPIDVSQLYQALYRYPYACTEQLVSRASPLLYAGQLAHLAGEGAPEHAQADIQQAIETVLSRQSADGAIGLWRVGDRRAPPWVGVYAVDFLSRASDLGYAVPEAALDRALDTLQPIAQAELWRASGYLNPRPDTRYSQDTRQRVEDRSAAFALYVLAMNGRADRSRLRYLHDERLDQIESPLARAHIGTALAALGDEARATSAFDAAFDALGYDNQGDWYQSPLRDLGGVMALAVEAGQTERLEALLARLIADMRDASGLNTQEKAFLIHAAQSLSGGVETVPVAYSGDSARPEAVLFDADSLARAGVFTNTGDRPIYITAMAQGAPVTPPAPVVQDLQMTKQLLDLTGAPVDVQQIEQGDRMIIALTLQPQRAATASYIIADLLPAGFEIEALVTPDEAGATGPYRFLGDLSRPDIAEARDDRFVAAIDGRRDQPLRLAYMVRAVTPGDFAFPGAVAEDMYKPNVFARTASTRLTITP